jgi:hypothetical protein
MGSALPLPRTDANLQPGGLMNAATDVKIGKISKKSNKNTTLKSRESTPRPVPELLLKLAYYLHATQVIGMSKTPNQFSRKARASSR